MEGDDEETESIGDPLEAAQVSAGGDEVDGSALANVVIGSTGMWKANGSTAGRMPHAMDDSGTDTDEEGQFIKQQRVRKQMPSARSRPVRPSAEEDVEDGSTHVRTSARKKRLPVWQQDEDLLLLLPQPASMSIAVAGRRAAGRGPGGVGRSNKTETPRSRHHNLVPVSEELLKEFGAAVNRGGSNEGSSAALRIVAGPRRPAGAITIKTLLSAGIMVAGQRVLSVEYKGNTTWGDLNEEGQITFAGVVFDSPSAASIYIKRLVNPTRKADDGWKAIKYAGRLLEHYKEVYLRNKYCLDAAGADAPHVASHPSTSYRGGGTSSVPPLRSAAAVPPFRSAAAAAAVNAASDRLPPGTDARHKRQRLQDSVENDASGYGAGDSGLPPLSEIATTSTLRPPGVGTKVRVTFRGRQAASGAVPLDDAVGPPLLDPLSTMLPDALAGALGMHGILPPLGVSCYSLAKIGAADAPLGSLATEVNGNRAACEKEASYSNGIVGPREGCIGLGCSQGAAISSADVALVPARLSADTPKPVPFPMGRLSIHHPPPALFVGAAQLADQPPLSDPLTAGNVAIALVRDDVECQAPPVAKGVEDSSVTVSVLTGAAEGKETTIRMQEQLSFGGTTDAAVMVASSLGGFLPSGVVELEPLSMLHHPGEAVSGDLLLPADEAEVASSLHLASSLPPTVEHTSGGGRYPKDHRDTIMLDVDVEVPPPSRHHPLIEVTTSQNALPSQSFKLHVSTSALVAMDLHAHLSCQPVQGLLGGSWDPVSGALRVTAAEMVREATSTAVNEDGSGLSTAVSTDSNQVGGQWGHYLFSSMASYGMDPIDGERALRQLQSRGLSCVGRYTSVPPPASPGSSVLERENSLLAESLPSEAAPWVSVFSPSLAGLKAQALFHRSLSSLSTSLTAPPALLLSSRGQSMSSAVPCVCATLRPYQAAAELPSTASCSSPSWFHIPKVLDAAAHKGLGAPIIYRGNIDAAKDDDETHTGVAAGEAVVITPEPSSSESPSKLANIVSCLAGQNGSAAAAEAEGPMLVSELSGLVGALVSEYGRRPGAMSFLSEPAWPSAPSHAGNSRLQYAVASAVVLLPEDCREAFGDVVLGALAACFSQHAVIGDNASSGGAGPMDEGGGEAVERVGA